ncbi:MAG TPA: hypothetical protein VGI03_08825 [Verrucomicrobiae bacterium]|jgi:hypothetical protein
MKSNMLSRVVKIFLGAVLVYLAVSGLLNGKIHVGSRQGMAGLDAFRSAQPYTFWIYVTFCLIGAIILIWNALKGKN